MTGGLRQSNPQKAAIATNVMELPESKSKKQLKIKEYNINKSAANAEASFAQGKLTEANVRRRLEHMSV